MQVVGLAGVTAIATMNYHSLALKADGTVWAWGNNQYGQLGDGTTTSRSIPVQVTGLVDAVAVACGLQHSMALKADGTVWAWGYNAFGQVGVPSTWFPSEPVQVTPLANITGIACGGNHSLALRNDGTVWAWGDNSKGQCGDGPWEGRRLVLTPPASAISAGRDHSIALDTGGTVWSWGNNSKGQLGDGTTTNRSTPAPVLGVAGVVGIASGGYHNLARRSDLTVWAWGSNQMGGLGDDTFTARTLPIRTQRVAGIEVLGAGLWHSLAASARTATRMYTLDRSGIIGETVTLRGYLYRASDTAPVDARTVGFTIDGVTVGTAVSNSDGRASLNWALTDGPATRTIAAEFDGDASFLPSGASAVLQALGLGTKMWGVDCAGTVSDTVWLKAYLRRYDNTAVPGKTIQFAVDGSDAGAAVTNAAGRALAPYVIPDGPGAGIRSVGALWIGDGGYLSSECSSTLYVQRTAPYIWVLPKSAPQGGSADLYAYFRRLFDYQPQESRTLALSIDGAWIADVTTGSGSAAGVARCPYDTSGLAIGGHTIRCDFGGDAWIAAGYGQATLTIY